MKENIIEDILKITNAKIFCLGDLMLDKYVIGSTHRISPEGPIPILDVKQEVQMLGGVGNVVRNLGTIGIKTYLVALVGDDKEGIEINKRINKKNLPEISRIENINWRKINIQMFIITVLVSH